MTASPPIPCRTVGELAAALSLLPGETPIEPNNGDYVVIYHPCSLHHGVIIEAVCEEGSWKSKTPGAPRIA